MSFGGFQSIFALHEHQSRIQPLPPLWTIANKADPANTSKKKLENWFNDWWATVEIIAQTRVEVQVNNLCWFLGAFNKTLEWTFKSADRPGVPVPRRVVPVVINILADITDTRAANLSAFKPEIQARAKNDEEQDRQTARLINPILDAIKRLNNEDKQFLEIERWNAIFGEVYRKIEWDPKFGDLNEDGEPIGDVRTSIKEPYFMFPEPKRFYKDVDLMVEIEDILHIEEVKKRFGVTDIEPDQDVKIFDFNVGLFEKRPDEVILYRVIHRPSEFLPKGMQFRLVRTGTKGDAKSKKRNVVIDISDKYPYSHRDLPYERYTDIDVPGWLHGVSFYQNLIPLQHQYNKLHSIIHRNYTLYAHPKWMIPYNSTQIKSLGNTATAVYYRGQVPPQVVSFPTIPSDIFTYGEFIEGQAEKLGTVQKISRGDVPAGTRTTSALRFFEEQQQQRQGLLIQKRNDLIVRHFSKVASVAAEYYPVNTPERVIRIVGSENEYYIERLADNLNGKFDIIIENASGFRQNQAGRIEELTAITQIDPTLLTPEEKADVLQLRSTTKAYTIATAALRLAQAENERMRQGIKVQAPRLEQDHFVHYREHILDMNTMSYTEKVPESDKERVEFHVSVHEQMMFELAAKSQIFLAQLVTVEGFPRFYIPSADEAALLSGGVLGPQGGAPTEEGAEPAPAPPVNGQLPA